VDLIVVGTRGKSGLEHVVLGSTAERIIRMAPCPVLVVRGAGGLPSAEPVTVHRILVPVDFSDCAMNALEYAVLVAQRAKASLRVLHVLEPVSYGLDFTLSHATQREAARAGMTERLTNLVTALHRGGLTADFQLRGGLPSDSILEAAAASEADLIVMGTHGRRGLSHAFWGSVAESVLRKSPCPVLAVRSPKFHPGHRRVLSGGAAASGS
jgi:nucleotide-binding universal stress UspA family protein